MAGSRKRQTGASSSERNQSASTDSDDARRGEIISQVMAEVDERLSKEGVKPPAPSTLYLVLAVLAFAGAYYFYPGKFKPATIDVGPPVEWSGALDPVQHTVGEGTRLFPRLLHGPAGICFTKTGAFYTVTAEGSVWYWSGSGQPTVIAHIGDKACVYPDKGPECGEAINILLAEDEKSLFVTDITKGLLAVSLPAGHVENLLPIGSKVPGSEATNLLVGLAVHGDDLYISDATTRWTVSENVNNFLEARGDGRILRYNLKNKKISVVAAGLHTPTELLLTDNKESLLVAEMSNFHLTRVSLEDGGKSTVAKHLPGLPRHPATHPDGGYILSLPILRTDLTDSISRSRWIRKFIYKFVPADLMKSMTVIKGICVHMTMDGVVINSYHGIAGPSISVRCVAHGEFMYFYGRDTGWLERQPLYSGEDTESTSRATLHLKTSQM